jgi:tetratricopeptide (TPR) repeat protein
VANDLAAAQFRVGKIAVLLGSLDEAVKPLATAQEMQERLLSQKPDDADRLKALGDTMMQLGQVWTRKNDLRSADRDFAKAVQIRERLAASFPENFEFQRGLANAYMNAGLVAFNMAETEADDKKFDTLNARAHDQYEKMQAIRVRLLKAEAPDERTARDFKRDFGTGCINLGRLAQTEDRLNDAINFFKAAITAFEEGLEGEPNDLEIQSRLATCRRLVGYLLEASGETSEARKAYEQALHRLDTLAKQNPDVAEYQNFQAGLLLNLFALEKKEDNAAAARAALENAHQIYQALAEKHPSVPGYQRDLAVTLRELAKVKDAAGEQQAAAADLAEAIRRLTDLVEAFPNQADYSQRLQETKQVVLSSAKPND